MPSAGRIIELHEVLNEIPEDKKCPNCFAPLTLEYATFSPTLEFWLYKCSGFCENKYCRMNLIKEE